MAKKLVPEPVVASLVCSLCDEPWADHGDTPTVLDCIRLLKAKLPCQDQWYPQYPWITYTVSDTANSTSSGFRLIQGGDEDDGTAGVRVPA